MKKFKLVTLAFLAVSGLFSANAFAENNTFTGVYLGGEISSTKHNFSVPYSELNRSQAGDFTADGSHGTRFGIVTGYGIDIGSNFVAQGEASLAISNAKTKNSAGETVTKEKFATQLSALLGYRVSRNFLPYMKVSLNGSSFNVNNSAIPHNDTVIENSGAYGFGLGAGVKYAISNQLDISMEYHKATLKAFNHIRIKTDNVALKAAYHF